MLFSGNTLHILRMVFLEIDQCDIWSSKRSSSQSSHAWVTILYTPIRAAGMYGDMESPPLHPTHTNQRGTDYAEQIGLSPPKLYIPSTYYKNSTINSIRFCTSNQERQKMDIWVELSWVPPTIFGKKFNSIHYHKWFQSSDLSLSSSCITYKYRNKIFYKKK